MGFVTRSRNTRNRVDGAKELKKLVYFSNIVVSPLLEDLKVRSLASTAGGRLAHAAYLLVPWLAACS